MQKFSDTKCTTEVKSVEEFKQVMRAELKFKSASDFKVSLALCSQPLTNEAGFSHVKDMDYSVSTVRDYVFMSLHQ